MRELKFRAWDKRYKKYRLVEGIYMDGSAWVIMPPCNDRELIESKYVNIEQYTGLKDKNGKEIYDGDIVSVWGCTYKVAFLDNAGMIIVEKIPDGSISQSQMLLANCCFECEVIGNIHENHELLEGK